MKKYLISGIGPGPTGVGRLVSQLVIQSVKHNYLNVYKFDNKSIRKLYQEKKYFQLTLEPLLRTLKELYFNVRILNIKNSEIILIHPQSIGIRNFKKLITSNNIVKWYIMDNSFFCMKSYNYLNGECLRCLKNLNDYDSTCHPYPYPYTQQEYNEFLFFLKNNITKFKLYAQSDSHKYLLHKFYGKGIEINVIGMDTGEINFDIEYNSNKMGDGNKKTIVFHNHLVEAKGFNFAYQLAGELEEYNFVFPSKKPPELFNVPKHIEFIDTNWGSGLKELVINADLVLCLSMWSTPIEGALIKSIYYNGNVAIMNNELGFSTEVPDNVMLKLDYDFNSAVKQIRDFINTNSCYSKDSVHWLKQKYSNYHISKLFEG